MHLLKGGGGGNNWNLPHYLQITVTPHDAINWIRLLHVYAKTENWQIKKELVVKRTYYIYIRDT
jgi:hypothetical protein